MTAAGSGLPRQNPGEPMRRVVGIVAVVALVEALAGAVVVLTALDLGDRDGARLGVGVALVGMGLAKAVGSLWHGARHHHERGRGVAIATVLVAVGVLWVLAVAFRRWRF